MNRQKKATLCKKILKRKHLKLSQREAENILSYIADDFMPMLYFMIVYHKYPFNLAYLRISEVLDFLDNIECKNKYDLISTYLFQGIEYVDEAECCIKNYYDFIGDKDGDQKIKNKASAPKHKRNYAEYRLSHYFYPPDTKAYISPNAPQNLLNFKKLFLMAADSRIVVDDDFWHYACEYLLMEDNDFQMFIFGPAGKNFSYLLDEDEVLKTEQCHDL